MLQVLMKLVKGDAIKKSSLVLDIVASLLLATRCPLAPQHRPSLVNAVRLIDELFILLLICLILQMDMCVILLKI